MNKNGWDIPNLNNLYNLIKLMFIFFIYTLTATTFTIMNNIMTLNFENNLILGAPFSFIITIFALYIINTYKIPAYTPKKQFKKILPEKIYTALFIISITLGCILALIEPNPVLNFIIILMIMLYLIKPYDKEIFKIKDITKKTLFNEISMPIFLIIIILYLMLVIPPQLNLISYDSTFDAFINAFSVVLEIIFPFMIPVLIYMYFLEKNLINPINKISQLLKKEITNKEEYEEYKESLNSITINNEIKILKNTLINMEDDLNEYTKNLVKITSQQKRMETELKLAHDIQYSMIPRDFEEFSNSYDNNIKVWGYMKPAYEVGGDFYDYFKIDEDNIGFVIGDVSGKGITASLVMVKAMTLIQDYCKHYNEPSKVFNEVNNLLCEGNDENDFVTCWLGKLNVRTGELSYVNAGHNRPLIKKDCDNFEYLNSKVGPVLGIMEDIEYKTKCMQLKEGNMIFLYTDGVVEANKKYEEFYSKERLKNILNQYQNEELNDIINNVEKDIEKICNNNDLFDDTTMFIIKKY